MTSPAFDNVEWLTIPDLVDALGVSQSKVRRLLEERHLVGIRRDGGPLAVPASFVRDGIPLTELQGTVIVLSDLHFSDEEILTWLLEQDDALGVAPIDAMLSGRKAEVRRVAMTLA
ncbi:MAG: Rv2175c family DNA-binding protein [Microbacteriaceae bacterium]